MKLIVGLGNPSEEYESTRHNVGFYFVDLLAHHFNKGDAVSSQWENKINFEALVCREGDILFAKPQTYMNESGEAVLELVRFFKVRFDDLFIIHDDLDIPLGIYKLQQGKGPRVHNGINSIEEKLGKSNFWRIRVGIENRKSGNQSVRISGREYVLQKFNGVEKKMLDRVYRDVLENLEVVL